MEYLVLLYKIIACHVVGDYALQTAFLAKNKGRDWYALVVHCLLYSVPFAVIFGIDWRLAVLVGTHLVVDALKARYQKIDLAADQILHYLIAAVLYLLIR